MGRRNCGLCGIRVESKDEHLKNVHGWVDCAYCPDSMPLSSLENHLNQKHNQQMRGLVASATRALQSKKDQIEEVAEIRTGAKVCSHCKVMVPSMAQHLENTHGYVRCKVCNNSMPADSLAKHLRRSHGQKSLDNDSRDRQFQHNNDIDKIQAQPHEISVPKLLTNPPFVEYLQPVTPSPPPVDLSNIYDLVADKNGASFINAPQTSSLSNVEGTYLNTILISDKELNKLLVEGRIGSKHGQLFLRDS